MWTKLLCVATGSKFSDRTFRMSARNRSSTVDKEEESPSILLPSTHSIRSTNTFLLVLQTRVPPTFSPSMLKIPKYLSRDRFLEMLECNQRNVANTL